MIRCSRTSNVTKNPTIFPISRLLLPEPETTSLATTTMTPTMMSSATLLHNKLLNPGCDRPIFCVQLLDILSSYLALRRCRVVRFLLDLSQKSGCSCVLRLQFLRCRALSSEDLLRTRELQDLPPRLRKKRRWKVEFRVNFSEIFFSESSIFLKKSPNSTSNPTSKSPVFLQIWTKITGHEKSVCHTLGSQQKLNDNLTSPCSSTNISDNFRKGPSFASSAEKKTIVRF